jgi:hypothetical protein
MECARRTRKVAAAAVMVCLNLFSCQAAMPLSPSASQPAFTGVWEGGQAPSAAAPAPLGHWGLGQRLPGRGRGRSGGERAAQRFGAPGTPD